MSQKFPGGFVTKSPVAPTTSAASGIWTLDQQEQYQKAGTWPQQPPPPYIEDVFSTWLYSGTGSAQTITNGIDLSTKGGLVWLKDRSQAYDNGLFDTARGAGDRIISNSTAAANNSLNYISAFNTNGFSLGAPSVSTNNLGDNYASWTFRKQAKFFDVVTWTGDGVAGRQISHSLGSAPGAIIVKCTNLARDWAVWQNTLSDGTYLKLNTTDSVITNTSFQVFGDASGQTSTYFTVGKSGAGVNGLTNANGDTYVAYLFADDAGGFGATETENVISCGSYTGTADYIGPVVNLGFEPQWLLIKSAGSVKNWVVLDNMRGLTADGTNEGYLVPNTSDQEYSGTLVKVNSTGFQASGSSMVAANGVPYIYIAIRKGPMKTPTDATKVFAPVTYTGDGSSTRDLTFGFPVDMFLVNYRAVSAQRYLRDRLRGGTVYLSTPTTDAEASSYTVGFDSNTGINDIPPAWDNANGFTFVDYGFRRAPSFFDEVCYTGDGTADSRTFTHNLGVTPQLVMVKRRSSTSDWVVTFNTSHAVLLNSTNADIGYNDATGNYANGILVGTNATTLTQYSGASGNSACNASGSTYVAYLFATCAGVSKVGSYTGTGALQTVNCGFTSGARFVLIKRTDSTGDWYTYDSARGITSGNDPYLLLNSTAAEVTGTNYVDTDTTGFKVTAAAPAGLNASGGTYIFLAIA